MEVDYMVLADAAAAAEGKLYIHGGGWDTVFAQTLPTTLTAAVALRIRVPWPDTNIEHTIGLDILDADGASILPREPGPLRGAINMGRPATIEVGDDQVVPIVIGLNGTAVERFGRYVIVFEIDGQEKARAPFRVKHAQLQQLGNPQPNQPPA